MTKLGIFNSLTTKNISECTTGKKLIENELCNQVEEILAMVTHVASRDFPWFGTHMYALLSACLTPLNTNRLFMELLRSETRHSV